jgi:clan AA aspartic protease
MPNDMGTFRIDVEIENPRYPGERRTIRSVLVDTGAELSWIPAEVLESLRIERRNQWRFRQADGTVLERWTGTAFVYAAGRTTTDEVVFGGPADLVLLGARSLEGLNLRVDPLSKQLVDAGPAPAAVHGCECINPDATPVAEWWGIGSNT